MKKIDSELRNIKPKFSPPKEESRKESKARPKTSLIPRAPSSSKGNDLSTHEAPIKNNLAKREMSKSKERVSSVEKKSKLNDDLQQLI